MDNSLKLTIEGLSPSKYVLKDGSYIMKFADKPYLGVVFKGEYLQGLFIDLVKERERCPKN